MTLPTATRASEADCLPARLLCALTSRVLDMSVESLRGRCRPARARTPNNGRAAMYPPVLGWSLTCSCSRGRSAHGRFNLHPALMDVYEDVVKMRPYCWKCMTFYCFDLP
jgi:hypothetical protein